MIRESLVIVHANAGKIGDPNSLLEGRLNQITKNFPHDCIFDLEEEIETQNKKLRSYVIGGIKVPCNSAQLDKKDTQRILNSSDRIYLVGGKFGFDLNKHFQVYGGLMWGCHQNVYKQIVNAYLSEGNKNLEIIIPADLVYCNPAPGQLGSDILSESKGFRDLRLSREALFWEYIEPLKLSEEGGKKEFSFNQETLAEFGQWQKENNLHVKVVSEYLP